jgi:hypothetical protein
VTGTEINHKHERIPENPSFGPQEPLALKCSTASPVREVHSYEKYSDHPSQLAFSVAVLHELLDQIERLDRKSHHVGLPVIAQPGVQVFAGTPRFAAPVRFPPALVPLA